ncbi:hypothetical protein LF845_11475 [Deferribacterales bacterium Es71-Z0220]|uniref:hypothetical protein n=1 Tax=Deferrivibrio essentukiensis TaxID=2880922 RepID=UPI001F6026DB|nr:hypothetical protein [Deferrivibrio essentukiensis]MCB4205567.1 hypothetical protein [Deferrivibrio essentukiensis]MDK2793116.1 hypothetical protein [Deferribacteres bacterium]
MLLRFFLLLMTLLAFCGFGIAGINNFPTDMAGLLKTEPAKVININQDILNIDKGAKSGFLKGRKVEILKKGKPVYHPVTKEILGTRDIIIGEGVVTSSNEHNSTIGIIEKSAEFKLDETVAVPKIPVGVKFVSVTGSEDEKKYIALLKASLNNSDYLFISDNGLLTCEVKSEETGLLLTIKMNDGQPLKTLYYPTENIVAIKKDIKAVNLTESGEMESGYTSISVINVGENKIIAAAGGNKVDFYELNSGKIEKSPINSIYLDEIINIESFDIDNDKLDELIISNLDKNLKPKSAIYKIKGGKTDIYLQDIKYLFRTGYFEGEKKLLYQGVEKEKFGPEIYIFSSTKNIGNDRPYLVSDKYNIYNTGFGDFDGDRKVDLIHFNDKKQLEVISDNKVIYKSVKPYGVGAKYFLLNKAAKDKENHGYSENDDMLGMLKFRQYIYPRIYEKNGEIFVYNNELKFPAFPLREIFSSSKLEKIGFGKLGAVKRWESDLLEPRIVDIYIEPNSNEAFLIVLKLKEGLFKKDKTNIMMLTFN